MQIERRGKRIYSFFLCRDAAYLIERYRKSSAEAPNLFERLCRDAAYLIQRYRKSSAEEKEFIHFSFAEMQLILSKDTANRAQKRQTCLSDYAEMQLIFYKDNEFYCQRLPYRGEIRTFVKQQKPSNAFKRHHTGL